MIVAPAAVTLSALNGVPMVAPGDDLSAMLLSACHANGLSLQDGDIVVLAQKIISKAEGRAVPLASVSPSD